MTTRPDTSARATLDDQPRRQPERGDTITIAYDTGQKVPADAKRILLVTTYGDCCALYIDGKLEMLSDPARSGAYSARLTDAFHAVARLAKVTVIENVDPRIFLHDLDRSSGWKRRFETLAEVVARQAELDEAGRLRQEADANMAKAAALEAHR